MLFVFFQFEQDLFLYAAHAGKHVQNKAYEQQEQGNDQKESAREPGPFMGGEYPVLEVVDAQENEKTQTNQEADEAHGAKQPEGFVVPEGPDDDL
jgi:hypothetical protein